MAVVSRRNVVFWRERYRITAAVLQLAVASVLLLDYFTQIQPETLALPLLSFGLATFAIYCATVTWQLKRELARLFPVLVAGSAVLASIAWGQSTTNSLANPLLFAHFLAILSYIGLTLPKKYVFLASPSLIAILLVASYTKNSQASLELGLLAIPLGVLLSLAFATLLEQNMQDKKFIEQQATKTRLLEKIINKFRSPNSLQEAANEIATAAQEIFEADKVTVVLRDPQNGLLSVTLGPSQRAEPDKQTAALVTDAIGSNEPTIAPYNGEDMLIVPLKAANKAAGAVVAHPIKNGGVTIDLAKLFRAQVSVAIEHLFTITELEKETSRDELTGLGNRKHANSLIESLQIGDALILLDLDGFKEVNDTLGHGAGDQVLLNLSDHLQACLRDSDASARLGGDEFLVLARRAFADPQAVAKRILHGWADANHSTTISAGVALHQRDTTPQDTVERADKALYQAKTAGKNRSVLWQELTVLHADSA